MPERPGFFRRFFGGLWRVLEFSRRLVLNVLFMVIVAVLLGNSATLAIVADLKANLGNVRYQAKKRGPALAALL